MEDWELIAIVIAALWAMGLIGLRIGYRQGYAQARTDRAFYDAVNAMSQIGAEEDNA